MEFAVSWGPGRGQLLGAEDPQVVMFYSPSLRAEKRAILEVGKAGDDAGEAYACGAIIPALK